MVEKLHLQDWIFETESVAPAYHVRENRNNEMSAYHSSNKNEIIKDVTDFITAQMTKIFQRKDDFK